MTTQTIKKPKILFIADKWCGGNKKYGISEWERGMQMTLESTGLASFDVFHLDDYFFNFNKNGDEAVLQKISEYQPDLIYIITNKMPGKSFNTLDWKTFEHIKNDLKIPMAAVWADLALTEQVKISLAILPYLEVIMACELSAALHRINRPDKYIPTWVPKDPRTFYNPGKQRDIELCYFGSPRKNRMKYIEYLKKGGVKVGYGGGEGFEHLTTEQYADRYQRSKIALSFSRSRSSHVFNTRPFEVMNCGAMLLEQESFELMKLYTPYVDYVPYCGKRDMLKKAKYYLAHDEEREKIARSGQKKTQEIYSAKNFWQILIHEALNGDPKNRPTLAYPIPPESLSRLSTWTAYKLRFLNWLCGSNFGFGVYRALNIYFWQESFGDYSSVAIGFSRKVSEKIMPKKLFEALLKMKRSLNKANK